MPKRRIEMVTSLSAALEVVRLFGTVRLFVDEEEDNREHLSSASNIGNGSIEKSVEEFLIEPGYVFVEHIPQLQIGGICDGRVANRKYPYRRSKGA